MTREQRLSALAELVRHLEGERPDLVPAEQLRAVRLVEGWAVEPAQGRAPGIYAVTADGLPLTLDRLMLVHMLTRARLPLVRRAIEEAGQ